MTLSASTLATELEKMIPTDNAGTAAQRLADAYGEYMKGAVAGATPITTAAIPSAVTAMKSAISFSDDSTTSEGAQDYLDGIVAFWGTMATSPGSFFSGASAVTPPPFTTFVTALAAVFAANTSNEESLEDSSSAIATALDLQTAGLGIAVFPGPTPEPIT